MACSGSLVILANRLQFGLTVTGGEIFGPNQDLMVAVVHKMTLINSIGRHGFTLIESPDITEKKPGGGIDI